MCLPSNVSPRDPGQPITTTASGNIPLNVGHVERCVKGLGIGFVKILHWNACVRNAAHFSGICWAIMAMQNVHKQAACLTMCTLCFEYRKIEPWFVLQSSQLLVNCLLTASAYKRTVAGTVSNCIEHSKRSAMSESFHDHWLQRHWRPCVP